MTREGAVVDGSSHVVGISMIAFDALDPPRLARFWAALLGGHDVVVDDDGDAWVEVPGYPRLDFLRVPESKTTKNRLHLDIAVSDVELATSEAVALGASPADDVHSDGPCQVLRDPEGNEFCLLPPDLS